MYKENPFGNPDGARANINELNEMFILDTPYAVDFTNNIENLITKRVIVGAKGSGKTVYLRKIKSVLEEKANHGTGIFVDDTIDQQLNCTEKIIMICDFYKENVLSEKWTSFWKIAIYVSLACKLINDSNLSVYLEDEEKNEIKKLLDKHKLYFKNTISVYEAFYAMTTHIDTSNKCNQMLEAPEWITLKSTLGSLLRKLPVIYMFLDSIDTEYEHAPMHWCICQKGLFYAVMELLQSQRFGERLHIIMAMRNNVFNNILRSEHSTKFSQESHVFCLDWSFENIKYFLKEKIKKLGNCYFINRQNTDEEKNIFTWLGVTTIYNPNRDINEDIISYIVRHTRLVPRDVIIICNQLSKAKRNLDTNPNFDVSKYIRDTIEKNSTLFGDELITICAKNISANQLPKNAGKDKYAEAFIATDPYQVGSYEKLKKVLKTISSDRILVRELFQIEQHANDIFEAETFISDVLWQNGALGYIDNDGFACYFSQHSTVDQKIPEKEVYIFRSCIAGCLKLKNVDKCVEKIK